MTARSHSTSPNPSRASGHAAAGKAGYATSSPELESWLRRHIEQGFGAEALVRSMRQSGYEEAFARATVQAALAASGRADPVPPAAQDTPPPSRREPAAKAAKHTKAARVNAIRHEGRDIPVLFSMQAPHIALFQQLLLEDECEALIGLARGRMTRSPVINPDTGDENLIDARTSMGAMFQVGEHPLIERLEARIAAVTGVPVEHGEGLQILNYKPGAEYQPHFDFFNPGRQGEARQLKVGGQRVATLVIYLNNVPAGGGTAFPKVGLEVTPVRGNAVFFAYLGDDGSLDERTLHAGLPVEQGEKWIATKWLRQFPYRHES
ncbi:2OG-Fe(II) oxygenase [Cupriavidus respiraculi]|uniref:2OG-Fe(II) oxygenase n=1 Tax=Cupriavidus respiraculi TaxID=195930 RepID=UPI001C95EC87|nr:2OG-Fe(II) oxygenase [Cupriavidus respiraculi]MBY4949385.1 2OG-Fe(II) oxygenase [Cupriavidus respiraculi]